MRRRSSYPWTLATAAVMVIGDAGCQRRFATEGDALRAQVLDLERENRRLERRVSELNAELRHASVAPDSLPEAVRAAQPHVASISLDRLSHAADLDEDGRADHLRLYVRPVDGRGRFVQLVGTLSVNAALMPTSAPASTVGQLTLSPLEVREAYRSGVTGTHYTLEVPLDLQAGVTERELSVRVVYVDGRTGVEQSTQRAILLGS